jgi:hypothetical protein
VAWGLRGMRSVKIDAFWILGRCVFNDPPNRHRRIEFFSLVSSPTSGVEARC